MKRLLAACFAVAMTLVSAGRAQVPSFMFSAALGASNVSSGPFGSQGSGGSTIVAAGIVLNHEWYLGALGSHTTYDASGSSVRVTSALAESRWYDARRKLGPVSVRLFNGVRIGYVESALLSTATPEPRHSGVELAYVVGFAFPVAAGISIEWVSAVLRGQVYGDSRVAGSGVELGVSFRIPR